VAVFALCAACHRENAVTIENGRQHVAIRADDKGFTPSSVTLKKGMPATLTFTRTTDDTCAKDVVFQEIDLKKPLPLNSPVDVDVPTDNARTFAFTCGMGMFKSAVVVQ